MPGIGVDVEEHTRWRGDDLRLDALFTEAERARCEALDDPGAQLAGLWCAKEAVFKAVSPYLRLTLRDIEVVHDPAGRPAVRFLRPELRQHEERLRLSISRTVGISVAVAVYAPPEPDLTTEPR